MKAPKTRPKLKPELFCRHINNRNFPFSHDVFFLDMYGRHYCKMQHHTIQYTASKCHCMRPRRKISFLHIKKQYLQRSHRSCTCKSKHHDESTQRKQSCHKQMYSQKSRLLQFVTRVPCLSFSDSPCKAELSSINRKKLLGETHTQTRNTHKNTKIHTHTNGVLP